MIKITAAAAALAALTTSSAFAATAAVINPGLYTVTTQYTALTDPNGLCGASGVAVGQFSVGIASVFGAGKTIHSIVPMPAAASTATPPTAMGVNTLTCDYSPLPSTLGTAGATVTGVSYSGSITCTASYVPLVSGPATYVVTPGSNGSASVNQVINKGTAAGPVGVFTNNSFHITSTNVNITVGGTAFCTLSTDSLYVRTGS